MDEVFEIITKCRGKRSLIAMNLGISLPELNTLCESHPSIQENIEKAETFADQLLEDVYKIRLELGVISGESWALNHMARAKTDDAIKTSATTQTKWEVEVTHVGGSNAEGNESTANERRQKEGIEG